jgi:hypothetical protein
MANRTRLLNTSFLTSDPYLLESKLSEPGNDYVEVAGGAYKIPIPWFLCFLPEDMRKVKVQFDADEDGEDNSVEVELPCTSVAQAIQNLEQSRPVFHTIVGDAKLADMFWQNSLNYLKGLPLPYLCLDPIEVMFMGEPEPYVESMQAALKRDQASIAHLTDLSCYEEGVLPYPLDVLYAVPSDQRDETRLQNCVALDIGYGVYWSDSAGSGDTERPAIPLPIEDRKNGINLRTLLEEVKALAKARVKSADTHFSFAPQSTPSSAKMLKMLVSAETDAECELLRSHKPFRGILDGPISDQIRSICRDYGFSWAGLVIRSDESVERRFKGDYEIYNDWISAPVEKPLN